MQDNKDGDGYVNPKAVGSEEQSRIEKIINKKINDLENIIYGLKETTNTASQNAKKTDDEVLDLLKQSNNQFEIIKGESRIVFALAVGLGSSILSIAMFSVLNILDEKALNNEMVSFAIGVAVSVVIMSIYSQKFGKKYQATELKKTQELLKKIIKNTAKK